jgi:hypothetical protein
MSQEVKRKKKVKINWIKKIWTEINKIKCTKLNLWE